MLTTDIRYGFNYLKNSIFQVLIEIDFRMKYKSYLHSNFKRSKELCAVTKAFQIV